MAETSEPNPITKTRQALAAQCGVARMRRGHADGIGFMPALDGAPSLARDAILNAKVARVLVVRVGRLQFIHAPAPISMRRVARFAVGSR